MNRFSVYGYITLLVLLVFLTREVMVTRSLVLSIDMWFENLLLFARTPTLLGVFNWVTLLGSTLFVVAIAGLVSLAIFFFKINTFYIWGLATALIGAGVSEHSMKVIIQRARPGGLIQTVGENSFSFPSGHATGAMVLYGFIASFLCRLYPQSTRVVVPTTVAIIIAVGFSRLYLGVHFPSDVVAGYILGGIWLLIGVQVTRFISSKRTHCLFLSEKSNEFVGEKSL